MDGDIRQTIDENLKIRGAIKHNTKEKVER